VRVIIAFKFREVLMNYLILAINPGSTSTKIALYNNETEVYKESIDHHQQEIEKFDRIVDQIPMRQALVIESLRNHGYKPSDLNVVMGRGGLFPPVKTGGYIVNEKMLNMILNDEISPHASNLGAVLADGIAKEAGVKAYIYDAVSAGDFPPVAKITGMAEIERQSFYHVLNTRAAAIEYANRCGKTYRDMNLIVVHMGGGITVGAHKKGEIVDSLADDNGPFAPERSGAVPLLAFIELCFNGKFTKRDMVKKVRGMGGLRALMGTSDCRQIEKMMDNGDEKAKIVMEAQAYQVAKGIGLLSPALGRDLDAIILTGGLAYSKFLTRRITELTDFLAPVVVMPGEHEMEALALGGLRILKGEEDVSEM
jgi:butyrate kinase